MLQSTDRAAPAALCAGVAAGQRILHALAHGRPPVLANDSDHGALRLLERYHVVERNGATYRVEIPLVARWVRERAVLR